MKKLRQYIGIIALLLVAGAVSSCVKDDYTESEKGSRVANVTVLIDDSTPLVTEEADVNEGIKTLRLIVVDKSNNNVEVNYYTDYANNESNEKSIILQGLSVGLKSFYVVANEASVGWSEEDFPSVGAKMPSEFINKIIDDPRRLYFPKLSRDIGELGLPIIGTLLDQQVGNGDNKIEIPIKHAVAKISLSFINHTSSRLLISSITLGNFLADKTYSFGCPVNFWSTVDYEGDTFYSEGAGAVIKPGFDNVDLIKFYVYETNAAPATYTLSMQVDATGVNTAKDVQFLDLKQILQNNWIKVTATISSSEVNNITLKCEVADWTGEVIEVPEFK